jgi:hypothetical protein
VCKQTIGALRNIASGTDSLKEAVYQAGAVPLLVGALQAHAAHLGVCELASGALRSIADIYDSRKKAVYQDGTVPLLVVALQAIFQCFGTGLETM